MLLIATPVVACYVYLSVSVLETFLVDAKTAELIEVLFGMWTWVGPK